jgi:hypothetical protein
MTPTNRLKIPDALPAKPLRQRHHVRMVQKATSWRALISPRPAARAIALHFCRQQMPVLAFELRQRPCGTGIPIASTQRIKGRLRTRSN